MYHPMKRADANSDIIKKNHDRFQLGLNSDLGFWLAEDADSGFRIESL